MSQRPYLGNYMQFAVSALLRETAINTEQTMDMGLLLDKESVMDYAPRRESNIMQATGVEGATLIRDLGGLATWPVKDKMCTPNHVAFFGAYGLGQSAPAAAGTGYKHTITEIDGDLDASRSNPSFTAAQRLGKHHTKERFASFFVADFSLIFRRDSWLELNANCPSTGKRSTNLTEETVNAAYNAASLTLAANGVAGASAAERLSNVHAIRVQVPTTGEWVDVAYSAVSDASPAIITITAPGGTADMVDYKIIYNIKEAGSYAWCVLADPTIDETESPLRVSDFAVNLGGKWDGSAIAGGHALSSDIQSLEFRYSNDGITPVFTPGAGSGAYANRALRSGKTRTLVLDRDYRDYLMGMKRDLNETFVFHAIAEGAVYDTPHKYTVELVLPKVGIVRKPVKLADNRLVETLEMEALHDDTYGFCALYVKNKVATYAA